MGSFWVTQSQSIESTLFCLQARNRNIDGLRLNAKLLKELGKEEYVAPKECSVCAIGAVFVCAVDRHDALKLSTVYKRDAGGPDEATMLPYLKMWFTPKQLRLMETAFEGTCYADRRARPSAYNLNRAYRFYNQFRRSSDIMEAIMNNVIDNKGTFKP